jgi:hypothetical protein
MTFKEKLKEILELDFMKEIGYKINKTITRIAFGILAVYLLILICTYPQEFFNPQTVIRCSESATDGICANPYYDESREMTGEECYAETIPNNNLYYDITGKVLDPQPKPNIFIETFPTLIFCTLALAYTFNHYKYNSNWFKELKQKREDIARKKQEELTNDK